MPIDDKNDRPAVTASPSALPVAGDGASGNPSNPIAHTQRALLERLAALDDAQTEALDKGDVTALAYLSELRGAVISEAAPCLPPRTPWEPELAALVAQARERAGELQQAVRACMAIVRRDSDILARRHEPARSPWEQQPD